MTAITGIPRVTAYTDCDLVHTASVFTGLIELAHAGEIDLCFKTNSGTREQNIARLFTVWLEIDGSGVCIDLHDRSNYVCGERLIAAKTYYKANYHIVPSQMVHIPAPLRPRIQPFGAYFPARPTRDRAVITRQIGHVLAETRIANDDRLWRVYSALFKRRARYTERLTLPDYEQTYPIEPVIFFNPGCWVEKNLTARQVNHLRAQLIRALRKEFGDRFVGGFVPSAAAQAHYPDLQFDRTLTHAEYIHMGASARVAIYTNGTHGCISWKLGEYLAAGACIVGEKLNNELPASLGDAFAGFKTADECLAHCHRLMRDDSAMMHARESARAYYREFVQPMARMRAVVG